MTSDQDRWDAGERDYKSERDTSLTTPELAREVERIANEIAAIMAVFPRLNPRDQTRLAIHGDVKVERLHEAWAAIRRPTMGTSKNAIVSKPSRDIRLGASTT